MGVIARVAEVLQEGVQLGKIVIEGGHLASGAGLGVRRASGLTDGLLYCLAVLISRLQHSREPAMMVNCVVNLAIIIADYCYVIDLSVAGQQLW